MSTLLYIQASPRGERSASLRVADAFLDAYRQAHPNVEVDTLNVFDEDLPAFAGPALRAKYDLLSGGEVSEENRARWGAVEAVIERFTGADLYLFAVPMWNFSIPYRLKRYIDVITQPGYTFRFDPESGYSGLVTGKPAMLVYARGGDYSGEMAPYDHQLPYMELILGFLGFRRIESVTVGPTLAGDPSKEEVVDRAVRQARADAAEF